MPTYKRRQCSFCKEEIKYIDYKNIGMLRKHLTQYYKIVPKYYSGTCLKHQKKISKAVKNARIMALIPFSA
ncbi:MAG: 30S ribosomal protein S18 [Candidatus Gracilibacteria bacterium]|jgi:small subunit ribosomal protein S18